MLQREIKLNVVIRLHLMVVKYRTVQEKINFLLQYFNNIERKQLFTTLQISTGTENNSLIFFMVQFFVRNFCRLCESL